MTLRLTPEAFWRLTPHELLLMCEGLKEEREYRQYREAWVTAYVVTALGAKDITPEKLLGKAETMSTEDKIRALLKAQAVAEGKDPSTIDDTAPLSPATQLEALMGGRL